MVKIRKILYIPRQDLWTLNKEKALKCLIVKALFGDTRFENDINPEKDIIIIKIHNGSSRRLLADMRDEIDYIVRYANTIESEVLDFVDLAVIDNANDLVEQFSDSAEFDGNYDQDVVTSITLDDNPKMEEIFMDNPNQEEEEDEGRGRGRYQFILIFS